MKTNPTILVINIHSSQNAGDLALLEGALAQLQAAFTQPGFILSANWPQEAYFQQQPWPVVPSPWVCAGVRPGQPIWRQILAALWGWLAGLLEARLGLRLGRGRWRRLLDAYRQADLVVGVGGNQFYSTGRYGWPFPVTALSIELAHLFKKPFYCLPQTLGPLKRAWERRLVGRLYGRARRVQLRDALSLRLAAEIGLPPARVSYTPDLAFDYPAASPQEAQAILSRYGFQPGQPALGVTILAEMGRTLAPGQIEQYYQTMAEVLARLIREEHLPVYFFIQVTGPTPLENDRLGVEKVLARLGGAAALARVIDAPLSPAQLKACYGCMQLFLATRLHSGIFALGAGVPSLFVGYLSKTRGVLEQLGLADWCLEIGSLAAPELYAAVLEAWRNRAPNAARLAQLMPGVAQASRAAGTQIAQDFNAHD